MAKDWDLRNNGVVKIRSHASSRVAELLLAGGPTTASALAHALGMTATAIRKHLDQLEADGFISAHERAPFGPADSGPRGRGRPAKVFAITSAGREHFEQPYDQMAISAIKFIEQQLGDVGVKDFARQQVRESLAELLDKSESLTPEQLAQEFADLGFSASLRPAPVGDAVQLCQHNCPMSHVASEYTQFCDAETEAIGQLLGVHVTRISTIASGSAICTTHIPVSRKGES